MKTFLVTVHEEWDKTYEVEAEDEDAAWKLEPASFTDEQLAEDEGGDISITEVREVATE